MKRAILTAVNFDLLGVVDLVCKPDQDSGDVGRRVSRVATLDGGAAFNDFGFAEADRTIELRWMPTGAEQMELVQRLVRLHGRVRVALADGLWLAAPERVVPGARECRLTLLVESRLA